MTEKDLKRIQSAYESGLDIEIWFDGRWYKFDARDYPYGGFSTTRQYRIVGQKYVDEAEKQIKDLQEQIAEAKEIIGKLCGTVRALNNPNTQLTDVNGFLENAEQFLKGEENE